MTDEKKMLQMIRIAKYEQRDGKEDIRIQKYDRRDYVAFAMIRNFFIVTIGYGLLLGVLLLYNMEFLLNNLKNLNLQPLLVTIGAGYLFVLALYTVLVYMLRNFRHSRASRGVDKYYRELKKLNKLLRLEEYKKQQKRKGTQEDL